MLKVHGTSSGNMWQQRNVFRVITGPEPLSQRQHLGRSSKAAAQKKLLEFSEEEDADSTDGALASNSCTGKGLCIMMQQA